MIIHGCTCYREAKRMCTESSCAHPFACCNTPRHTQHRQLAGTLFNVLFNLPKFVQFEMSDPFVKKQEREEPQLSDWDRFARAEYIRYVAGVGVGVWGGMVCVWGVRLATDKHYTVIYTGLQWRRKGRTMLQWIPRQTCGKTRHSNWNSLIDQLFVSGRCTSFYSTCKLVQTLPVAHEVVVTRSSSRGCRGVATQQYKAAKRQWPIETMFGVGSL